MINQQLSRFATHENSAYPQLWSGCVGAWCPSLGPSGARLHDYSRRNNWGTLTNMDPATDWVVSDGQYTLDFDGSNDAVTVPAASSGLVTLAARDFTVSWWMNIRSAGENSIGTPWDKQAGDNAAGWYYLIRSVGGNTLAAQAGVGPSPALPAHTQISGDNFHRLNIWDHIVIRWSRSAYAFALFRNGSEISFPVVSQGTQEPGSDLGVTLTIGNIGDTSRTVDGLMDDMRIYNRALSLAEIRLLARRRGIAFTPRARRLAVPEQAAAATNTLTVSNATLNLTGQSSSLILSRKLLASNGSLNLAGQTSSLSLSRSLSTSKADLNISGQSSLLQVARLLSASNGTIEFSGQSADLRLFRNLSVNNASLSLSGQSATVYAARSLTVDHADVNLSGQVVTLSAGKTLTVNNGEIQFVGQQVSLTTQRNLTIVNTDISLSGQSVSMKLTTQQNLTVSNAGIEVQGQQVTLRLAKSLVVLPAEIQNSGQTAQLTVARKLAVQNGDVDLAGQDVMVRRRFELGIGEGQVSFSGEGIGLLSSRKILATEGRVQFSGQAVQIYPTFQNPVQIFGGNLRFIDKTTGSLRFIQEITR